MAENTTATDSTAEQGSEVTAQAQEAQGNNDADSKPTLSVDEMKKELEAARKEAAKYRVERNEYRTDAEKFREQQEAEKSDLQRIQERAAELEQTVAKTEAENQRLRIVSRYGIAEENISLLGDDPEKFESNAQRLADLQEATARRSGPPSDVPVEDLRPGASSPEQGPDLSFPASWPVNGPFANT